MTTPSDLAEWLGNVWVSQAERGGIPHDELEVIEQVVNFLTEQSNKFKPDWLDTPDKKIKIWQEIAEEYKETIEALVKERDALRDDNANWRRTFRRLCEEGDFKCEACGENSVPAKHWCCSDCFASGCGEI